MGKTPNQVSALLLEVDAALQQGRSAAANRILQQVIPESCAPDLARGLELWRGNRPGLAARCLAEYSNTWPGDILALQVRAHIASQQGAIDEAIELFQQCLALYPDIMALRPVLARLLMRRQRYAEASVLLDQLLQSEPDQQDFLLLKAKLLDRSGQYPAAIELLHKVIAMPPATGLKPDAVKLAANHTTLGIIQRTVGAQSASIQSLQTAISLDPCSGRPWYQLADLKVYKFQPLEIEQIRRGLDEAKPGSLNEVHFAFALGRALESQQDLDGAFAAYARGNRIRAALAPFDMAALEREFMAIKTLFATPALKYSVKNPEPDCPAIFVVGMPRSGTTLVDQITTAHSMVDGTMELPVISALVRELQQRQIKEGQVPYPAPGTRLTEAELAEMGQQYLQRAQIQRGTASFFVDKMPINFQHIGLIRKILPGARIVNVRRNPMALGLSIYQQLFSFGQDWAFDLTQIARYYLAYSDLMDYWESQAPGHIVQVQYEELVISPESSIRKLLQQLNLPEDAACFSPHENQRPVRTASSEQVRQPMHTAAVDYWRNFEPQLEPLRRALETAGAIPHYPASYAGLN